MRIALCQLNSTMGDIAGNSLKVCEAFARAAADGAELCIFPELFLQGYPPRDLLEHQWFIKRSLRELEKLCLFSRQFPQTAMLLGMALPNKRINCKGLSNSAVILANGEILFQQDKSLLPTYDVFDEDRYFDRAESVSVFAFKDEILGITICEDAWNTPSDRANRRYEFDPVAELARQGATLFINISGSPFHAGKQKQRSDLMCSHARQHGIPLVFVNLVGGNDELIFDGCSMVADGAGMVRTTMPAFSEDFCIVDSKQLPPNGDEPQFDTIQSVHDALVLGLRDYATKCGFHTAIIGLSGGIDSAVTCALASASLGPKHVVGVTMPSRYSSKGSVADSEQLAANLGVELKKIPIEPAFAALLDTLYPHFAGKPQDLTEENMQARIRGNILMALSNKFGHLLLSTGNKSEMAVGYCTLYGDMNGGLSVISDLPKTSVYALAAWINRQREIIPKSTLTKPPSAELRPGQKDQDTLPPYDILDKILAALIEQRCSQSEVVKMGFDEKIVAWIAKAIRSTEYKRRQAAPGLKVTPKAFGIGRRFPIAAKYEW